ncbi:unnamed protein product [Acanthoscelides obtectus]|uniref:WD repeat-containing protein 18 n=1 Tax=Acanthoscelides obtectus TaxID=200917 RepID=A0A9P0P976_ACAOB|nr:unnamed protein product [Acanthoscelides obtectus]CAK1638646.1 WD repeat-containing protein 18 [Acanthoscelides obtectus]
MDVKEYLLTSSQHSQQFSACLWDYNTLNVMKLYRNGGTISSNCLEMIGDEYILTGEVAKPLLHVWLLNNQDVSKNVRLILPEPATCLAVCPKQVYLAVGMTCKLYIWHISSGKLLSVQQKNYQPITCIKFSSDGAFVLVGGQDGMLVVYNLCDLIALSNNYLAQTDIGQVEPVYVKNDHSLPITNLHVGSFGKKSRLATVSTDQTCRLYNLLTGENLLTLVFDEPLTSVVFDACCWQLYVGCASGIMRAFNLQQPPRTVTHHITKKSSLTFEGHTKKDIELSDDENSIEKEKERDKIREENTRLRVINKQLYNAALEIRKKYSNNLRE